MEFQIALFQPLELHHVIHFKHLQHRIIIRKLSLPVTKFIVNNLDILQPLRQGSNNQGIILYLSPKYSNGTLTHVGQPPVIKQALQMLVHLSFLFARRNTN